MVPCFPYRQWRPLSRHIHFYISVRYLLLGNLDIASRWILLLSSLAPGVPFQKHDVTARCRALSVSQETMYVNRGAPRVGRELLGRHLRAVSL